MKKIYRYIFTAVALLSLIPLAFGDGEGSTTPQKGPDYYLNDDGSIGYMKKISEPNTQGIYTITLESFATGSSVKLQKSVPADIVLVLDVSGSMAESFSGGTTRLQAMKNAVNSFIDKVDENDRIDPIKNEPRSKRLGNRIAIIAFSGPQNAGNTTPTANNSIKLNTGWRTLGDNQDVDDNTGYNYLKNTAVRNLSADGGTFSNFGMEAAKNLVSNLGSDRTLRTVIMFTDGDPGRGDYWDRTENIRIGWNQYTVLSDSYGRFTWQTANQAIGYANDIKKLATSEITSSVYSVSIISDPSQCTEVYLDQISSNYSGAEEMAELLTRSSGGRTYYYIENWNYNKNNWTARTGQKVAEKYALQATSPEELYNIFETIASDSGGGSEDLGEATIAQVDVVSASFMLPSGTDKSQIKVYISKVSDTQDPTPKTYIDEDDGTQKSEDFLEFDARRASDPENGVYCGYTYTKVVKAEDGTETQYPNTPVDESISVSFDENNSNKIIVSGFDYGAHWCGPRYDEDETTLLGWHGYKLIVEIPIKMDPNAVGGPDVQTNAEGSGVIVNGVNVAPFRSPEVSLPVNIHIRKEGLDVGESAKFSIERKKVSDPETAWVEVSSVFVTRHKGQAIQGANAPICKVVGMPSVDEDDNELVYRVVEKNWNWSYDLISIKSGDGTTIGNVNTRSVTSDELVTNPFIFVNSKKSGIDQMVRHAESKATNTFKTGLEKNDEYDDSKNNGRPVIEK